jgi:drug/metabolite transporter (DMT)-like permease
MPQRSPWLYAATIAVLVLIWGTTWAAIRIGLRGVPPFTGAAIRFAVAVAVLFAVAPKFGVVWGKAPREKALWAINGVLFFCVSYGIVYWAEQWVPSGLSAVLFASFPLLVAILAHFLLPGERLTAAAALGVLLGFAGVATIYSEDFALLGGRQVAFAACLFLASPIACAVANIYVKKWGRAVHPISLTAGSMLVGTGVLGSIAIAAEHDVPKTFDAVSIGCILYLAICGTAVTFGLYFWLLKHLPATKVALIAYGTPVVAMTVGCVFLGEPLTARVLAGGAGVLAGTWIAGRAKQSTARREAP